MNRICIFFFLASSLAAPLPSSGQASSLQKDTQQYSFSLAQAVDFAMKNQVMVLNAALDGQIAKYKVREITGLGLPRVNASFDVKDFVELPTSLIPADIFGGPPGTFIPVKFGTRYNATAGLDGSQLLFDGNYIVGLQAAKVYRELASRSLRRTEIETAAAVAKAYYAVLVNAERLSLMDVNLVRIKKLMDDTKALYDNGFVEKIDLDRITVTYNNLLVEKEKVNGLAALGLNLLKFQMGMDLSAGLTLTDSLAGSMPSGLTEEATGAYARRAEVAMFQARRQLAALQLRKDRMSCLPGVVLYGALSAQAMREELNLFDPGERWYALGIVGLRLSAPVFDGLQRSFRIQQSRLSLLKAQNEMKMLLGSIDLELASAKTSLLNASASLEMQKKNIDLAKEIYRVAKLKYDQGVGSSLEVLNAETTMKEAQTNYYQAMYDLLVAGTDYEKASGTLMSTK